MRIRTPSHSLLVLACALALGTSACSSGTSGQAQPVSAHRADLLNAPITGFGGYFASGPVTDVRADWQVPQITDGSSDAHASTWIGVQDPEGDFIQIGTTEDESSGIRRYTAFWSDPVVGFHPQFILAVRPGDEVSARLAKDPEGWTGTIQDRTTGSTVRVPSSVHYARAAAMQRSEWVQEDPATQGGTVDLPYPLMTPVTFSALEVDGKVPDLTHDEGTALASPNGEVLVPSAVRDDSFTMERGTPAQGRYLGDVGALDSAFNRFSDSRVVGSGTTAAHGTELMTAIVAFDRRVLMQEWSAGTRADIQKLVTHNQVLLDDLHAWERSGEDGTLLARFSADAKRDPQLSNPIRADLGLPPI